MTESRFTPWPTPEDLRAVLEHPRIRAELLQRLETASEDGSVPAARFVQLSERLADTADR